jgi:hypothetical protein
MDRSFAITACLACTLLGCSSGYGEESCPPTALCDKPAAIDAGQHGPDANEDGRDASADAGPDDVARDAATSSRDAAPDMHVCGNSDNLCPQICPKHLVLAGGTRVLLGACEDCNFSIGFEFTPAPADLECVSADADLVVQSSDGSRHEARARLTQDAWDQLGAISLALERKTIETPAKCADCPGKASVRFHPADAMQGVVSAEHEYPIGEPPAALRAADELIQGLIDQLASCRGPSIRDCEMHAR